MKYTHEIAVRIGGREHKHWESYEIDSDFLIPADGFVFTLGLPYGESDVPDLSGAVCEVAIDGQTVLSGIADTQLHDKEKRRRILRLSGRDLAGLLTDCSAPLANVKGLTLLDAVGRLVAPWKQIKGVRLRADKNPVLDRVDIEPGESVWQAAAKLAASKGLHVWMEADGTTSPPK